MKSIAGNKICANCRKMKKDKDFPKHKGTSDGLDYYCRECNKIKGKIWREKNSDIIRNRKKIWNKENHDKVLNYHSKWRNSRKISYTLGDRARHIVMKAIKNGILERKSCEFCGNKKSQAHHPNYNKPLEVIWLCYKHHQELHWKEQNL